MIEELITRWGHLGIAVGTFFEGETVLFMGGALAHKGLLKFPQVVLAAFVGSLLGDQFWFFSAGAWVLALLPGVPTGRRGRTTWAPSWRDGVMFLFSVFASSGACAALRHLSSPTPDIRGYDSPSSTSSGRPSGPLRSLGSAGSRVPASKRPPDA